MPKGKINLLPKDSFEFSTLGKFLKWATSTGRIIVVLTEFIVICAFLSRFYFDTQLANLFDELKQKKAIVASAANFEEDFLQAQEKIKIIKSLLAEEQKPSTIVTEISQLLPMSVFLTSVNLDEKGIVINGYALAETDLQIFWLGLNQHPHFQQVTLTNISSRKEGLPGFDFTITASLKNVTKKETKK